MGKSLEEKIKKIKQSRTGIEPTAPACRGQRATHSASEAAGWIVLLACFVPLT